MAVTQQANSRGLRMLEQKKKRGLRGGGGKEGQGERRGGGKRAKGEGVCRFRKWRWRKRAILGSRKQHLKRKKAGRKREKTKGTRNVP